MDLRYANGDIHIGHALNKIIEGYHRALSRQCKALMRLMYQAGIRMDCRLSKRLSNSGKVDRKKMSVFQTSENTCQGLCAKLGREAKVQISSV